MENYVIDFFKMRPAISKSKFAKEVNIDRVDLGKILIAKRKVPAKRRGDFYRIMKLYGYIFDFDCDYPVCYYPV